jgi:hypothetical protein
VTQSGHRGEPPPLPTTDVGTVLRQGAIELINQGALTLEVKAPESEVERAARLRRQDADATFERWARGGVYAVLALVALVCGIVAFAADSPDRRQFAQGMTTLIVGGFVGFFLGKKDQ